MEQFHVIFRRQSRIGGSITPKHREKKEFKRRQQMEIVFFFSSLRRGQNANKQKSIGLYSPSETLLQNECTTQMNWHHVEALRG